MRPFRRSAAFAAAFLLLSLGFGCEPVRGDPALKDFSCALTMNAPPSEIKLSQPPVHMTAMVTNRGPDPWPGWRGDGSRRHNIHLAARWMGPLPGGPLQSTPLFEDLPSGATVRFDFDLKPPPAAGRYTLRVEPLQPDIAWFGDAGGGCMVQAQVTVLP